MLGVGLRGTSDLAGQWKVAAEQKSFSIKIIKKSAASWHFGGSFMSE